jgi:hypothetical protein
MSRKIANPEEYGCQWFALCDEPATHFQPHPVLTAVPCCDGCRDKLGLGAGVMVSVEYEPEVAA